MKNKAIQIKTETENNISYVELSQWYWCKLQDDMEKNYYSPVIGNPYSDTHPLFVCSTKLGSNYVELKLNHYKEYYSRGYTTLRIHLKDIEEQLIKVENPEEIIKLNSENHQKKVNTLLQEVKELAKKLGVVSQLQLQEKNLSHSTTTAIVPSDNNSSIKKYKSELQKAKEETLPELYDTLKKEHGLLNNWLGMQTFKLEPQIDYLNNTINKIQKRIFNVDLYAGLSEECVHIKKGKTANYQDKIHLMQRRLYMDEECLINYTIGGMEFKDIHEFDTWLSKYENFNRCLPFPKCIVTFKIRRYEKYRPTIDLSTAFINIDLATLDKLTFMYIRNGENLYRLNTELNFGEKTFPDLKDFDPQEPMMLNINECQRYNKVKSEYIMTKRLYNQETKEFREIEKKAKKWDEEHSYEEWKQKLFEKYPHKKNMPFIKLDWERANPYKKEYNGSFNFNPDNWKAIDKENLYYDEAMTYINNQIEKYNRIALIVQGIIDRSEVLHPHPQIDLSENNSFQQLVKLIYDDSSVLYEGDKPDIDKYFKTCNNQITENSYFVGQYDYWKKSNKHKTWLDNGPLTVMKGTKVHKRSKKVTFTWQRERSNYWLEPWKSKYVTSKISVPFDKLFNISAYKPGDYKQFFQDPRTRAEYLKWAECLLTAEEFHAGNIEVN